MGEKRINFRKIIKGIKRQSIRMQQRLIVYWCVVILTLFLATVLLLSIIGVLPGMDFKVREMLSAQQKNTLSTMTEQTDIMMARSISLSEDITKELNQCLTANGKTFSDLNDNPQLIMDLEKLPRVIYRMMMEEYLPAMIMGPEFGFHLMKIIAFTEMYLALRNTFLMI